MKKAMKIVLCFLPLVVICAVYGVIVAIRVGHTPVLELIGDLLSGVGGAYIGLALLASVLLCLERWWGGLFGVAMGALMIYNNLSYDGLQHVNIELPLGTAFIAAYVLLGLWAFLSSRAKRQENGARE